ncbi:uncharacterized protein PFLUO_LOCUS8214 [Penicillium psychrofluorescens]|uniref:uncharacterized protein n=1 Tax=Penicillium psychrofluorescens TaxID=3158075 RepID=UPI003CCD0420
MWASDSVFKGADGTRDSLTLRIRSRLTMSVIYDVFWWWREEIAGLASPYKEKRDGNSKDTESERHDIHANDNQRQDIHSRAPAEFDSIPYFGTEFDDLAEFSWTGALKGATLDQPAVDEAIFGMTPGSN